MRRLIPALVLAILASGCVFRQSTDVAPLTKAVGELAREGFHARETAVYKKGSSAEERLMDFVPPDRLRVDARESGTVIVVGRSVFSSSRAGYTCTPAPSGFNAASIARQLTATVGVAKKAKKTDSGFTFVYESGAVQGKGVATLRDGHLVRLVTSLEKGTPSNEFPVSQDIRFSRIGEPPAVTAPPTAKPAAPSARPTPACNSL